MSKTGAAQVFTDMPFEEYQAIDALSASGIRLLAAGPLEYWYDRYGVERKRTDAMLGGQVLHAAVLEGIGAFERRYARAIDPADHPLALDTQADLKGWCADHGLKVGGTKRDLATRIMDHCHRQGTAAEIMMVLEEHLEIAAANAGQEIVKPDLWDNAVAKYAMTREIIEPLRDEGGLPEVSIIWERDGVKCKARLDLLAPNTILDLKTVQPKQLMPFGRTVAKEIANAHMTIQAEWYLEAAHAAQEAGALPFDQTEDGFFFHWLFLQREGTPNMAIRRYMQQALSMVTGKPQTQVVSENALATINKAVKDYRYCMDNFGPDEPWRREIDYDDMLDESYPAWFVMQD